ncbi:MAG TPA: trypsin-like peptidase domain-containing protein [Spirochaetales bacterium]|nr:trypsin-like peptidase domain-containing protein [Spirochaetales bacterium]
MKRYSRGQAFLFALLCTALVVLVALGFGWIQLPGTKGDAAIHSTAEDRDTDVEPTLGGGPEEPVIWGGNSPREGAIFPVNNGNRYTEEEQINIQVYELRNEGVVNITTEILAFNWFLEPVPREGTTGSGSIIDNRGYVLTNNHVVEKAYKVQIALADGTQVEGEVVGADPENDLAVVKFDPKGRKLTLVPMGSSSTLKVGQRVLAIGNPFAFDRTLTTGIISGLGRPIRTENGLVIQNMIQTDASINPGNSGGPLLDIQGNIVGINTMIYSPSGGSVGIGFAVPVDTAKRVVPEIIKYGRVVRGWIDVVPVQLFPALVQYAKLPVDRGLLVSRTLPGGNAEKAGIRGGSRSEAVRYGSSIIYLGGDIIVEVDGTKVGTIADLYVALEDNKPGETVSVVVYRGSQKKEFKVVLSERPEKFQWE